MKLKLIDEDWLDDYHLRINKDIQTAGRERDKTAYDKACGELRLIKLIKSKLLDDEPEAE